MPFSDDKEFKQVGKYMSLILRHQPELMGLTELELGGWVNVDKLLETLNKRFRVTSSDLNQLVKENNKQRYSFDFSKTKIRANQGHSVEVDLQLEPKVPPKILFHGTEEKAIASIQKDGLKKMYRHAVHLSPDPDIAKDVGDRRGKAVVLKIKANLMSKEGHTFYRSDNGVWLTEAVPIQYIEFPT